MIRSKQSMFKGLTALLALMLGALLSGCEEVHIYDSDPAPRGPTLRAFHMIDSYGVSSEQPNHRGIHLDPYEDYGLFEVYWYARMRGDYRALISVNDRPGLQGAVILGSDYCGPGLACDDRGFLFCEYTPDFYMGCGIDRYDAELNMQPIDRLIRRVPDRVFFNLELCSPDGRYCEVSTREATLH